jgi:hypothetical protein
MGTVDLLVHNIRGEFRELGAVLGFGGQGGLRELGPSYLLVPWLPYGFQILGPRAVCRSPIWNLGLLWYWLPYDQHHAHNLSCSCDIKQNRPFGL